MVEGPLSPSSPLSPRLGPLLAPSEASPREKNDDANVSRSNSSVNSVGRAGWRGDDRVRLFDVDHRAQQHQSVGKRRNSSAAGPLDMSRSHALFTCKMSGRRVSGTRPTQRHRRTSIGKAGSAPPRRSPITKIERSTASAGFTIIPGVKLRISEFITSISFSGL